jgi:hypothetical protein
MNAPRQKNLDDAIIAAVEEPGAVVIGWVLVAAYRTPEQDGETGYFYGYLDGQPFHSSLGLLHTGIQRLHHLDDDT